ncbi:MAG: DUF6089 family protein [Bacteroidota bacterium]
MKVLRFVWLSLFVVVCLTQAEAQFRNGYFRIGASTGPTNYLGDLDDDLTFRFTRLGFGFNASYKMNPFMSARLGFYHGWARAADSVSLSETRRRRNLHFRTPITEGSFQIVFDFVPHGRKYYHRPPFVPYVFGGIALFRFDPQAYSNVAGRFVSLQPIGTEGQNLALADKYPEPYSLIQMAIPLGAGIRMSLSRRFDLEIETGFRKTFTDYLDDVSGEYIDDIDLDQLGAGGTNVNLLRELYDRIDRAQFPDGAQQVNGIRGDRTQADWYIYTAVRLNYIIDWRRCPSYR